MTGPGRASRGRQGVAVAATCAALGAVTQIPPPRDFRVEKHGGRWSYVSPAGARFFSLGVCCVGMGAAPDAYSPANPEYAAHLHYRSAGEWATATLSRLRAWGFTTVGGWSDYRLLLAEGGSALPITPVLHAGSTAGIPWLDMWDPAVLARVDETAGAAIEPVRDSPLVLGYYADNELGWWNAVLVKMTLEMAPESIQRRKVVALIKRIYRGSWQDLLGDFDPEGASSFEEFDRRGFLYLRPGGNGARVERRILGFLADRYYRVTRDAIRKHDPRRLLLGDRYQSFYYPEVARASRRYVDVVSTNLNAHWIDGSVSPCYLRTLHELTGKPVQVGEFYMCATDNRSGNRNSSAGFPVVPTQRERAEGFRRTALLLAQTPFVVGADWFQYCDEPTKGRADGEDYNMGLVDIHDVPYAEMVRAAASLDVQRAHADAVAPAAAPAAVPRAPADPLARFEGLHAIVGWDRERGLIPPSTRHAVADLYACWDESSLYLAIHAMGFVEASAYREGLVPECDRSLWTLRLGRPGRTVSIRFGAGRKAVSDDPEVQATAAAGTEDDVRTVVVAVVPARVFGALGLQAGTSLPLDVALDTAGRCDHVHWKRTVRLL